MPAAGVEPALDVDVGRCWKILCQNAFQTNKKRAEPMPRPYEKSVHAVTFFSQCIDDIRPRQIIDRASGLDAM